MPIYEYNCPECQEQVNLFFRTFAEVKTRPAVCPQCGSDTLERVISRVTVVHNVGGGQTSQTSSGSSSSGQDESDPKVLANMMREAGQGRDMGPEFREATTRLEAGETPMSIEKSLRQRMGQKTQTH